MSSNKIITSPQEILELSKHGEIPLKTFSIEKEFLNIPKHIFSYTSEMTQIRSFNEHGRIGSK